MSKIAEDRARLAKQATGGTHYRARSIDVTVPILQVGDQVRIRANGHEATIQNKGPYGWVLEGVRGWFPAQALEKLPNK